MSAAGESGFASSSRRLACNKRIAALEAEFAELAYVEEMLVAVAIASGEDVHRSPDAPPQAVLGVQLVEAKKSRAA